MPYLYLFAAMKLRDRPDGRLSLGEDTGVYEGGQNGRVTSASRDARAATRG